MICFHNIYLLQDDYTYTHTHVRIIYICIIVLYRKTKVEPAQNLETAWIGTNPCSIDLIGALGALPATFEKHGRRQPTSWDLLFTVC